MENLITNPDFTVTLPVTLAQVKQYLRIDENDEDSTLNDLLASAVDWLQRETRTTIPTTQWIWQTCYRPIIAVTMPPLVSVESINCNGETVDPSTYQVTSGKPGRIKFTSTPAGVLDYPLIINFTAGYATVPHALCMTIKWMVGHWFNHREGVSADKLEQVPLTVESVIDQFSFRGVV